ncbi:FtsX-like permease family protein [Nocardioides sp. LS1]|uniref:FtsX-like permease family protein n=1 Tax=Nocardioides sp. LS1 TaxID=1027620 RepID=UPI000F616632|nr:FtsX-like permease family protein [Nocardioides sp. LS1]GCD90361.1 lipoprotein release ABC transporter permease [Nocardioides sp. LS1]
MNAWLAGWRLSLRLARREGLRARGRSILVLVMIALPVLGVTAADVVLRTQDVNSAESLDRRLGTAEAKVTVQQGTSFVHQGPDPDQAMMSGGDAKDPRLTAAQVAGALGGARLVEERSGQVSFRTAKGDGDAIGTEVDLGDPLTTGLYRLTSGRLPQKAGEVVVNAALAAKGYAVGDSLDTTTEGAPDPTIVGIAESATNRDYPEVAGPIGSLDLDTYGATSWLVDGDPVSWTQVLGLNARGASVLSRAVVLDPPPLPPEVRDYIDPGRNAFVAIVVLVIVMALIEVVLLAGPAFAVGARRQSRSLALMSATGGTPAQARRVVLGSAVVLGGLAALAGVAAGIGVGRALVPVAQAYSGTWFGPFEVPWPHLLGIAGFGLLSAFLAAVVPATIASRQDVVAVLAGRRSDKRPSLRSPLLGLLLLGAGVAGAAYGSRGAGGNGEYFIAGAAIVSVLGMILLVPVVLVAVSALSARLPLTLRYAARDAARHRSRTVPAVAAVAATVAGVVALGIATSSDEAQNEATYVPTLASGIGLVTAPGQDDGDWPAYRRAVEREVPGATVEDVRGLAVPANGYADIQLRLAQHRRLMGSYGSSLGSDLLVAGDHLPPGLIGISDADRARADAALSAGGIVAFSDGYFDEHPPATGEVTVRVRTYDDRGKARPAVTGTAPAAIVRVTGATAGPQGVVSAAAAQRLGIPVATVGLVLSGTDISEQQQTNVDEALAAISDAPALYVERGYVAPDSSRIIQWVLFALGAVLMLGGTLTATFLALSDARPDLATLSAVGASPGMRRGVAAAYAVVVGVVGALLGVGVGFIPGVAITYPLTGNGWMPPGSDAPTHYLAVPWALILGLVVVLSLLTALVVGLSVRSGLPLVARLD